MTRYGRASLLLAVTALVAGLALGYPELIVIGAAVTMVLLVALGWTLSRPRLVAERVVQPNRVTEGDEATAVLTVTNVARRRSPSMLAHERFGDHSVGVSIPRLEPGAVHRRPYRLPTTQRGVFQVGPLMVRRADPFQLVGTGQDQPASETLWVHPRLHKVLPFPHGTTRDLEGPTSGEAPRGGIAFHALREYVSGDDLRLIHWRSSAKTDRLMVRHNVDTLQPRTLVIFDVDRRAYDHDGFEDAVRVVASIMVANAANHFPVRLRTTAGLVLSSQRGDRAVRILDQLAAVEPHPDASLRQLAAHAAAEEDGFSLVVITGSVGVNELAAIGPLRGRFSNITIGRLGVHGHAGIFELPGAVLINASTSKDFVDAWNRRIRR